MKGRVLFFGLLVVCMGLWSGSSELHFLHALEFEDNAHLGVASCASSVCHGKLAKQENENVWLNEFRVWSSDDRHARAYKTLLSDESKLIARKLGLKSAQSADICLDCHADNVTAQLRDTKFQVSDGVGCEACHGGAKLWIDSHTEPEATHADNLKRGMYPTEDPRQRATLCLSCHMGTNSKFATHEIMGAGHPRLSFELEAFTVNQPAHYTVDADYIQRKRSVVGFGLWVTGQVEAADTYLNLLQGNLLDVSGMFPEFSFYDCHSCHHPMDDKRWTLSRKNQGLKPGTLRLQDQHLLMLQSIVQILDQSKYSEFKKLVSALLKAGQSSKQDIKIAAGKLSAWISARRSVWLSTKTGNVEIRSIRKAIADMGAKGLLSDYASAEQAFLGIESLSLYLGDADKVGSVLDQMYNTVESDQKYSPAAFRAVAQKAVNVF